MSSRALQAWLIVLATAVAVPAAGQDGIPYSPRIALLLPLSGDYGHLGRALLEAAELALEAAPGVVWSVSDTRGEAAEARRLVREIAANPAVTAIVGPVGSEESRAAAEAAAGTGIPLLTLTSADGVESAGPRVFRLRLSPAQQARFIARTALEGLELRRFAVLYPDDAFGREAARAFVDEVVSSGARVTALEAYPGDEANLSQPVELLTSRRQRRLRGSAYDGRPRISMRDRSSVSRIDFEAVFIPDYAERVALALPFLAFWDVPLGSRTQLLGLSSWAAPGLTISGELADGALFPVIFHADLSSAPVEAFVERYRSAHGRLPSEAEAQVFDALNLVVQRLSELADRGALDRAALSQALLEAAWQGVCGPLAFDRDGGVQRDLALFTVDGDGTVGEYYLLR